MERIKNRDEIEESNELEGMSLWRRYFVQHGVRGKGRVGRGSLPLYTLLAGD
jgi:hypothetical protein